MEAVKGLAAALASASEKSDADDGAEAEVSDFDDAAKDAFEAQKADDVEAYALALKRAIMACVEAE